MSLWALMEEAFSNRCKEGVVSSVIKCLTFKRENLNSTPSSHIKSKQANIQA